MRKPASQRDGATFEIEFEGERLACVEGETIAAAFVAHGRREFSTDKQGGGRGLYCGMGVCHDCLVTVDGRSGERACLTAARPGQSISRHKPLVAPDKSELRDLSPLPAHDLPVRPVEVLVIGAGPAGLAAALAASQSGAQTIVLDERPSAGGQFYKQPANASVEKIRPLDAQAQAGRALIKRAREAGAQFESGVLVWGAARDDAGGVEIMALSKGEASVFKPKTLIVATGAF
jgi:NADPH-dependent 2,4-dienoyl-CoA reductase/sulfur reductase-like enzyme